MITAACHIHSDWSYDGSWTVANLAKLFKRRGVRVLLMTEHDRGFSPERFAAYREVCAQESSAELLIIPGIEYSDPTNTIHVLVWGMPFIAPDLPTSELLNVVKRGKGIAVLAHPSRRDAWSKFDPSWIEALSGIELWNRKTDGWAPSRKAEELLVETSLIPFVGLDFHTRRQLFPLSLNIFPSDGISEESILHSLRLRAFKPNALGISIESSLALRMKPLLILAEKFRSKVARIARRKKFNTRRVAS